MKVWVSADYEGRRKAMGEAWDNDLQICGFSTSNCKCLKEGIEGIDDQKAF